MVRLRHTSMKEKISIAVDADTLESVDSSDVRTRFIFNSPEELCFGIDRPGSIVVYHFRNMPDKRKIKDYIQFLEEQGFVKTKEGAR